MGFDKFINSVSNFQNLSSDGPYKMQNRLQNGEDDLSKSADYTGLYLYGNKKSYSFKI